MTFNTDLARKGPGLLVRDLMRGDAQDVTSALARIAALTPDIAVLRGIDFDHDLVAIRLMQEALAALGHEMPFRFAFAPNSGLPTPFDLDRDGRFGRARDKQGFGFFRGNGGMAILSRYPIRHEEARDMSGYLWQDLPGATWPVTSNGYYYTEAEMSLLRLHAVGAWDVPIALPTGVVHILASHASPPVFDGPEDRNGLRNAAELSFWALYLSGALPDWPDPNPASSILAAGLNADPNDGEGAHDALAALLTHPALQDPQPASAGGVAHANADHISDPRHDTVDWPEDDRMPGNLRVDYLLPGIGFEIEAAGVDWPVTTQDPGLGSAHKPVWLEFSFR